MKGIPDFNIFCFHRNELIVDDKIFHINFSYSRNMNARKRCSINDALELITGGDFVQDDENRCV